MKTTTPIQDHFESMPNKEFTKKLKEVITTPQCTCDYNDLEHSQAYCEVHGMFATTPMTSKTGEKPFCLRCGREKIKGFYEGGCSAWGSSWKRHLWHIDITPIQETEKKTYTNEEWEKIADKSGLNPAPIQETWQEIAELIQMGVGLEDEETTVVLNILNEFAKPLLQRKERETIKRVMEVRPDDKTITAEEGDDWWNIDYEHDGYNTALQEWTDNITKLLAKIK